MNYHKFTIKVSGEKAELLLAFLSQLPFEAFEEKENSLEAWLSEEHDPTQMNEALTDLQKKLPIQWTMEAVAPQNWNAIWEANHESISVEDFCQVRADFHPKSENIKHDIIVNPKMAFGTAHHETTYMMILQMKNLPLEKASVLDLGCGTGVLAILAAKIGATDILAIDVDENAYENTLENLSVNHINQVKAQWGTLNHVVHKPFDIILANINRKVILDSLPALNKQLNPGGILLISGILQSDKQLVLDAALANNFTPGHSESKNGWICVIFIKNL